MATQIFVNLPVKDLKKSVQFFTKLGYTFDPQFTDENATCMIVGDNIFVMLLVEPFFKTFTKKAICDATKSTEVLMGLSAESRAKVDKLVAKAVQPHLFEAPAMPTVTESDAMGACGRDPLPRRHPRGYRASPQLNRRPRPWR